MTNLYLSNCVNCGYETDSVDLWGTEVGELCYSCYMEYVQANWTRARIRPENLASVYGLLQENRIQCHIGGNVLVTYELHDMDRIHTSQREMVVVYVNMSSSGFHRLLRDNGLTNPSGTVYGLQVYETEI